MKLQLTSFLLATAICAPSVYADTPVQLSVPTINLPAGDCSGQLKLATVLEFSQYNRSDSLGVRPPLY
ncbi:hypothetical protein SKA34_01965 [Photobacterium sp. SKA34]|nr:hypothetical protein SKA34_01965 [Photobacterium sp. SKA34]